MRIAIIEDEQYTADYLSELLTEVAPDILIDRVLHNVEDAVAYLQDSQWPDLLFCDIHLTDGSSFEIFQQVSVPIPVIFVTAYNQYALQAFKANGIDYVLKPFNKESIAEAIKKFRLIYTTAIKNVLNYGAVVKNIADNIPSKKQNSILIKYGEKIKPIKISDVAVFYTEKKSVYLATLNNEKYAYARPLEEIEKICGDNFYRVNRQVILNKEAIQEVLQTYSRKLLVKVKVDNVPSLEINKTKMTHFLTWLSQ